MPYLRGTSLQKRLDDEGPLPLPEILRIGTQIAAGLAAAHAQGLVHRDIKPANILLEEGVERVTITDFGLARAVDDATLTHSGVIAGTPQYMSPEQARGEPVDQRSDLFSLGERAVRDLHRPAAVSRRDELRRACGGSPTTSRPPIREINPEIPDWLVHDHRQTDVETALPTALLPPARSPSCSKNAWLMCSNPLPSLCPLLSCLTQVAGQSSTRLESE